MKPSDSKPEDSPGRGTALIPSGEERRIALRVARKERRVREGFWRVLRRAATRIPFMEDLVASCHCALDPSTPLRVRMTLLGALTYFVTPVDWIPDFIAVIGFSDDVSVLAAAIAAVRWALKDEHYQAARASLARFEGESFEDGEDESFGGEGEGKPSEGGGESSGRERAAKGESFKSDSR